MRNGFMRGILFGTVVGAAASMLMNPRNREKAKEMLQQGSQMLHGAEDSFESAGNWVQRSAHLFQNEGEDEEPVETEPSMSNGKENINQRVAFLERRLEELEHKGV